MGKKDYGCSRYQSSRSRRDDEQRGSIRPWIYTGILIGIIVAGVAYFKMQRAHMFSEQMADANQAALAHVAQQKTPPATKIPQPRFDFYSVLPQDNNKSLANDAVNPPAASATENPAKLMTEESTKETNVATKPQLQELQRQEAQQQQPQEKLPEPAKTTDEQVEQQLESQAAQQKAATDAHQVKKSEPPVTTVDIGESESKPTMPSRQKMLAEEKKKLEQEVAQAAEQAMPKVEKVSAENPSLHYILSLGLFKDHTSAEEQRAQLVLQGLDVNMKTMQKGGKTLYRLWMGPYTSIKAAREQQTRLQSDQIKSVVVKEK